MKNKWMSICISMILMLILSGCSLAKDDASSAGRLVGAFITSESLNLNEERLYATIDKTDTADMGEWKLSFDDREGMLFLMPEWTDEDGEQIRGSIADKGINHLKTECNVSDESSIIMSGDIYWMITEEKDVMEFYLNPVYQTEDDEFYVSSGSPTSAYLFEDNGILAQKISEEKTVTSGKSKINERLEVQVQMSAKYAPTKIWILQMGTDDQVVKKVEYAPDELPESITAEEGTAYFIVKTEHKDKNGKNITATKLYERKDTIEVYCASDEHSSFLRAKNIEIK